MKHVGRANGKQRLIKDIGFSTVGRMTSMNMGYDSSFTKIP